MRGLDQRITFRRRVKTPDGIGGETESWQPLPCRPCVWAQIKPRFGVGRESLDEGRLNASQRVTFLVRARDDIDETMQLQWRGQDWNIQRVVKASTRLGFTEIDASSGLAQ